MGLGRGGLVELDRRALDAVDAGHTCPRPDQVGQGVAGWLPAGVDGGLRLHMRHPTGNRRTREYDPAMQTEPAHEEAADPGAVRQQGGREFGEADATAEADATSEATEKADATAQADDTEQTIPGARRTGGCSPQRRRSMQSSIS